MTGPKDVSPLVTLRLGSQGAPSLRDVAKRIRVSAALLSLFELGKQPVRPDIMKRYAKALRAPVREVEQRWLRSALAYHHGRLTEIRAAIAERGHRPNRPGRRMAHTG